MADPGFVSAIERVTEQQVPPNLRPAFEEHLAWLRQIASERQ
jgi:hypothetical protein